MCCRRRYENGACRTTRRCRQGPIRALVGVIVKAVEDKRQERALLKTITPEVFESKPALKERYPPAVLGRELAPEPRPQQTRTYSAPPPEYRDEKSMPYGNEQPRRLESQAPPPVYEKVVEERW